MLFLVFGGCCTNVWAYEELLRAEPNVGPALTFSQMLFITAQQLPSFITWNKSSPSWFPRLKPRQVPIAQWLLQVSTFASGTLLNNIVFAFNVPPTIQIVFRSAGLAVSMILGRFFMDKRYTLQQIVSHLPPFSPPSNGAPPRMLTLTVYPPLLLVSFFERSP
jgi:UDP-xylose/UDP-N-acetylglucosamine transporter B4